MGGIETFADGWLALIPAAIFFAALAGATKRGAALTDFRRAIPEWRTNLLVAAFDMIAVKPFVAIPMVLIVLYTGAPAAFVAFWAGMPLIVTGLAAVAVGDYVGYWRHRLEHAPWLWRFHATHHSDRAMGWLTLYRMHPINRLTTVTIDFTLLFLAGFPVWAITACALTRNLWGQFIHADLPWTLGPLGRIVVSPSAHRWHHVRDRAVAGRNFSTLFILWDRMHGTWHPSVLPCRAATGVDDHSGGFLFEMLQPLGLWRRGKHASSPAIIDDGHRAAPPARRRGWRRGVDDHAIVDLG